MRSMKLLLSAIATSSALAADEAAASLFSEFTAAFQKTYTSDEDLAKRRSTFVDNLERISEFRARNPKATFSHLTRWADMTEDEFSRMHGLLSPNNSTAGSSIPCQFPNPGGEVPELSPTADPGSSLDYVELGATVAVKDQGNCSSCWAHATTAVVEGRLKLDTGNITSLSEQYLLDCDKSRVCSGCCGGLSEDSMQWLAGESGAATGEGPGISSEEAYPYTSASGTDPTERRCDNSAPLIATVTGFGVLADPTEASVLSASKEYGILSVTIDAKALQFYTGGVITDSSSCSSPNHQVAIVGYGEDDGVGFYKVRNSYSADFGEDGYFRISRTAGADCGMLGCVIAGTGASYL